MKRTTNRYSFILAVTAVLLLTLPTLQFFFRAVNEGSLYGYVDKKAVRPENMVSGWMDKDVQQWWSIYFDDNVGFKNALVRTFNEITYRLFGELPRVRIYSTPEHGLYSQMSIDSLNYEIVQKQKANQDYRSFAKKAAQAQASLQKIGKHFVVIIASSKPYIYPDSLGDRFLPKASNNIFSSTASLAAQLRTEGVNVIDSGPLLRDFRVNTNIDTHPYSGVHWNYYSGCLIARELLDSARQDLVDAPRLNCGEARYEAATMIDLDGLLLMNTLTDVNLIRPTPYPSPSVAFQRDYRPSMLLVGDSFMDQIVYSLQQTDAYAALSISSYFQTREVRGQYPQIFMGSALGSASPQAQLIDDALRSDVVILQMVDYNVSRFGYGFIDSLLEHIKSVQDHGKITITSVAGAHDRESDGNIWWHWVERKVDFGLQPSFLSEKASTTRIHIEFSTRGTQAIKLTLFGQNGLQQEILLHGDGVSRQKYDGVINISPKSLTKLSIESSREPTILGESDPRKTNFLVSNLTVSAD